ncbi:hypothetical protein [Aliiglaciecola aliphaticivorans]
MIIECHGTDSDAMRASVAAKIYLSFSVLDDHNAKLFWERLCSFPNIDLNEFLNALIRALEHNLSRLERMTPKEREKHRENLVKCAQTLEALVEDTPYERITDRFMAQLCDLIDETNEFDSPKVSDPRKDLGLSCFEAVSLKRILQDLQHLNEYDIDNFLENSPISLKKPNDRNSHRAYFIQIIANYFEIATGKPQRELVRLLCVIFFPNLSEPSDSDIRRIAPSALKNNFLR